MRRRVGKVLIVNTADEGGGTERFASLLLEGLRQRQIDVWMIVGHKSSNHPRIIPIHSSPFFDYRRYDNFWYRSVVPALRTIESSVGLESYRYPFSRHLYEITGSPPDVVLVCNVHGGFFDIRQLGALSRHVPLVLRPGDAWLVTGHCAVPAACERWRSGCGKCPDLARPPSVPHDLTRVNWRRKRRIYRRARWSVVAPSNWQMQRLNQSILRHAAGSRHVIRNGVDQSNFHPGEQLKARQSLELPANRVIALIVTNLGQASPFRDFHTLRAALAALTQQPNRAEFDVVVVGREGPSETIGQLTIQHRPYCTSSSELALYYQAADFLVNPTREETFSNVVAEAMCCGIPVLASRIAAIPEIVSDNQTGILVAPADIEALALALARLSSDEGLRRHLASQAAARAKHLFSLDGMIDRYVEVFESSLVA
jgi:glycosyltransferase involved in cell wall biosynthesis